MRDYTADDFESTHVSVTQWVHIGNPPWSCIYTSDPEVAHTAVLAFLHVAVPDSQTARRVLQRFGISDEDINEDLMVARYGPVSVLGAPGNLPPCT